MSFPFIITENNVVFKVAKIFAIVHLTLLAKYHEESFSLFMVYIISQKFGYVYQKTFVLKFFSLFLKQVSTEVKLPVLYLIDCIVKNVGGTYTALFSKHIVHTFCGVFKVVCKILTYT